MAGGAPLPCDGFAVGAVQHLYLYVFYIVVTTGPGLLHTAVVWIQWMLVLQQEAQHREQRRDGRCDWIQSSG